MFTRKPVVAGQFYAGQHDACLAEIRQCLESVVIEQVIPSDIVAGIVPHAGWVFSGSLAAAVFSAVKESCEKVHTFVIFGAVHSYYGQGGAVYDKGAWMTPLGEIKIDEDLAGEIVKSSEFAESDLEAHHSEHSIEVQVPFIQHLFPGARIVPIMVGLTEHSIRLGEDVAKIISGVKDKKIVCLGSTDLTHYGPRYGFYPEGVGEAAIEWAKDVNDMAFIDAAVNMEPKKMLATAAENFNACGAGAAAAVVAAAKKLGRENGVLLAHAHSNEVMKRKFNQTSEESVGYAAIVY